MKLHLIYHQNIKLASMALKFHLNIIKSIFVSAFNKNLAMRIGEERPRGSSGNYKEKPFHCN